MVMTVRRRPRAWRRRRSLTTEPGRRESSSSRAIRFRGTRYVEDLSGRGPAGSFSIGGRGPFTTERFACPIQLALAALLIAFWTGSNAASQMQASPFPSGPLVFRVSTVQFRTDGTFVIESSIEGMGTLRASGQWRVPSGMVEFIGYDAPSNMFEKLGISTRGCETPGRYRYEVDGRHVRLDVVADECDPRRMLFDRSSWAPAGTPEAHPLRRIVATAANRGPRYHVQRTQTEGGQPFEGRTPAVSPTGRTCRTAGMGKPASTCSGARQFRASRTRAPSSGTTACS
jgi:hypothetical protein